MVAALAVAVLPMLDSGASDPVPAPDDVKAGWIALLVFVGLAGAVVFLGFSLVKQLRKARAARDAGVYGDPPVDGSDGAGADERSDHPAQP